MEQKRILLVEDSSEEAELVMAALGTAGVECNVWRARDGAEAWDYLRRQPPFDRAPAGNPDFILTDLNLPRMSGLELLRALRATESLQMIPVIMLTSSREASDIAASYEAGSNAYVVKPTCFEDFTQAVRGVVRFWGLINRLPPLRTPGLGTSPACASL